MREKLGDERYYGLHRIMPEIHKLAEQCDKGPPPPWVVSDRDYLAIKNYNFYHYSLIIKGSEQHLGNHWHCATGNDAI
jgi:hypothetical protein